MKKRISVERITAVVQQAEQGVPVGDLCRKVGISAQSFHRWKKEYGGLPSFQSDHAHVARTARFAGVSRYGDVRPALHSEQ